MRFADVGAILTLAELLALRRNGVDGVNPYIDPGRNAKDCTAEYLRDIYRAGLYLGGFFVEDSGGAPVPGMVAGDEYFDAARGRGHATYVNERLQTFLERGLVPAPMPCWYADDTRLRDQGSFDDYATAVEETAIPELQAPGVYGFEQLLRWIQERQTDGRMRYPNLGPRAFLTYGHAQGLALDGWQNEQVTIEGITVDLSEMYIAGWRPKEDHVDDEEFKEKYARLIAPGLEAEVQERTKAAIDEAVDRAQLHKHPAGLGAAQPSAQFFRDLPAGAEYEGLEEDPARYFFQYPDGSKHQFDAHTGVEIT